MENIKNTIEDNSEVELESPEVFDKSDQIEAEAKHEEQLKVQQEKAQELAEKKVEQGEKDQEDLKAMRAELGISQEEEAGNPEQSTKEKLEGLKEEVEKIEAARLSQGGFPEGESAQEYFLKLDSKLFRIKELEAESYEEELEKLEEETAEIPNGGATIEYFNALDRIDELKIKIDEIKDYLRNIDLAKSMKGLGGNAADNRKTRTSNY